MPRRPALRRPVLGAGTEDRQLGREADAQGRQRLDTLRRAGAQARLRQRSWQRRSRFFGELRETLRHLRQLLLVQRVAAVDQSVARLADESNALGNVGQEGDQGRLERVGQHIGALVAAACQLAGNAAARAQRQLAMREGAVDDAVDFGHALEYRRHPARRQGIELQAGVSLVQPGEQRLRQYRVTDPGRRDDESFHRWLCGALPVFG